MTSRKCLPKSADAESLNKSSTEQLTSQHFALVAAISEKDCDSTQAQVEVRRLETQVEGGVSTLQENIQQQSRLQQKADLLADKLAGLVQSNALLAEQIIQMTECHEVNTAKLAEKLDEDTQRNEELAEKLCQIENSVHQETEKQKYLKKNVKKTTQKIKVIRSQNKDVGAKLNKLENKHQKLNGRIHQVSKESSTIDLEVKGNVDAYNDMKQQSIVLEKDIMEANRRLTSSQQTLENHLEDTAKKEVDFQQTEASKSATVSDLFLLNDSICALRSTNAKTSLHIKDNRRNIAHWTDKNIKNTDQLADVLNNKNRCSTCGDEVLIQ